MNLGKILIILVCVLLGAGFVMQWLELLEQVSWSSPPMKYFLVGAACFVPMWFGYFRRTDFWATFEHELTHLIVGVLCFKKPHRFLVVEDKGGALVLDGGNFLISLSPYFLPTLPLLFSPLFIVIAPKFYLPAMGVFGWLFSFNLLTGFQEFHLKQTDITSHGIPFSLIVIFFGNLVCLGCLIAFVSGGFGESWEFLKGGVIHLIELVRRVA